MSLCFRQAPRVVTDLEFFSQESLELSLLGHELLRQFADYLLCVFVLLGLFSLILMQLHSVKI